MKQIFDKKGKVIVEEVPAPLCEENGMLIKTVCSLISSGTDTQYIRGRAEGMLGIVKKNPALIKQAFEKAKREGFLKTLDSIKLQTSELKPLGYSSAGIVVEVGKNVSGFVPGDRVACGGMEYANHAEYVYVPKNLVVKMPEDLGFEEASFTTIGAIAMQGVRRAQVQIGETVVVIGLGLIGMLTAQILKAAGCKVIGVDIKEKPCSIARQLGIKYVFNSSKTNLSSKVNEITNFKGADSVLVTAASPNSSAPIQQAIEVCRQKGKVIVVGHTELNLDRSIMYYKEIDFGLSCSYGPGRYDSNFEEKGTNYPFAYVRWTETENMQSFLELIAHKQINIDGLIGGRFSIEQCSDAYENVLQGKIVTAVFIYSKNNEQNITRKVDLCATSTVRRDKVNISIIGAGRIVKDVHLPNLAKIFKYNIYAIASRTAQNAQNVAKHYKASYYTTDYKDILADKNCDAVLIATRNNLHAQIAIDAAKAGKAIYLEKPMATNEADLNRLTKVLEKTKVPFMVGFNRRYSPFVQMIKKKFANANGPWMINYTANFGKFNPCAFAHDHTEGGGRIISECCHYFDLTNHLIDSKVQNIICIPANNINPEENFTATIKYEDGSLANFFCSATGNITYPKEKFVVFREACAAEVYDYKTMKINNKAYQIKREGKGHLKALYAFYDVIKSRTYDLAPYLITTEMSIKLSTALRKQPINEVQNV